MEEAANSQRAIIFFLWKKGRKNSEIVADLLEVFGTLAATKATVQKWVSRFKDGRESLEDDPRSGRPTTSVSDENVGRVEELVELDRRVTLRELSDQLGISFGSIQEIVSDRLGFSKICARWVPRLLGPMQKRDRVNHCRELLALSWEYGEQFWQRIITVDETPLPFFNPETKAQSMQWHRPGEPRPVKAKTVASAGKVIVTVFWDCEGIILVDYLEKGRTINAEYYSNLLKNDLREALKEKRPGKLDSRPLLQHDNARPHTARFTMATINELKWELLPHPAYSPDLAPSDYHLFGPLKKPLRGIHFETVNDLRSAVNKWIKVTPAEFYAAGLRKLTDRWRKCIDLKGEYIEKIDNEDNN
jgi:histone-lysine N-methyltransferase SETMAR